MSERGAALRAEARGLAERAARRQDAATGAVRGAATSITSSRGDALAIEATAVCVLAWLEEPGAFAPRFEAAVRWLASRCAGGRFGSTQATVLALKAIVAYDAWRAARTRPGEVTRRPSTATAVTRSG